MAERAEGYLEWVEQLEQEFGAADEYHLKVGRLLDGSPSISLIYPCEEYQGVDQTYPEALQDLLRKVRSLEWKRG